ncbi:formate transporter 1-related [Anaeramoeba flamelloides]|uniref:Formate transporter 1-related n=1 Tax=Anaeramoeba flamelloides TaxID=1746091 RepID=A0AAV8A9A2_9EUKA|nr:formate transporter 1-related [Anaeramoeba flamelloides]
MRTTNKEFKTGKETLHSLVCLGEEKGKETFLKIVVLGLLGGLYIGFSGIQVSITVGGSQSIRETNPGLANFLFGGLFPIGFIISSVCGGDIFGNGILCLTTAFLSKKVTFGKAVTNSIITLVTNLIGSFLCSWILTYESDLLNEDPYNSWIISYSTKEVEEYFFVSFLKAVGGTYLIGLSLYSSVSANDIISKIAAIWFPILAFGALGFDHATVSMYFISLGLLYKAPKITFFRFLWHHLFPITLGNIIGSSIFVATIYFYLYYQKNEQPEILLKNKSRLEMELQEMAPLQNFNEEIDRMEYLYRIYRVRKVSSIIRPKSDNIERPIREISSENTNISNSSSNTD